MSDSLDDFLAEKDLGSALTPAQPASAPGSLPQLPGVGTLSLRQVEQAGTSLDWSECVAVMRGFCDAALASADPPGQGVAAWDEVIDDDAIADHLVIDAHGAVGVSAAGPIDGAVAAKRVAELFRRHLDEIDAPTQLMLALSLASLCTSLQEFSKSIERFERPDRAAVIRGVYERCVPTRLSSPPAADKTPVQLPAASQKFVPRGPARVLPWPTRRQMTVVGLAAFVMAVGTLAFWSVRRITQSPAPPVVSASTRTIAQVAAESASSAISAIRSHLPAIGPFGGPNAGRTTEPSASPLNASIRLEPERRRTTSGRDSGRAADATPQSARSANPGEPVITPGTVVQFDGLSSDAGPDRIYSADDADVVPPVSIYPQFPSTRPSDVGPDSVAEFEAVVTESGGVESVRARRAPATISEAMIVTTTLSAAKTWRFHPALKNGMPVKYRKIIWVVTN